MKMFAQIIILNSTSTSIMMKAIFLGGPGFEQIIIGVVYQMT